MESPPDHLVFSHTLEVLFRKTLAGLITPSIEARLCKVGVDLSKPLDPAYPMRVFDDAIEVIAVHAMSERAMADALRKVGELQVESFKQTFIGAATFQFLKLLSLPRFLGRMTQSWRQANNFVEATVAPQPDGSLKVRVNDVGRFPEVIQGVLSAAIKAAGHKVIVSIGARDGLACEYELRFPVSS